MYYFKEKLTKSGQGCDASVLAYRIKKMEIEKEKRIVFAVNKVRYISHLAEVLGNLNPVIKVTHGNALNIFSM